MTSLKAIVFRELFRWRVPRMRHERGIEGTRRDLEALSSQGKPPQGTQINPVRIQEMEAVWITPPEMTSQAVILYLHGGAYVAGSITSHVNMVSYIAKIARMRALLIDYRLAPEHLFPAALEDAVSAYHWLLETGTPASQIIIMGDSAGGGLTLATLLKLRDTGTPLPAAAVCMSPWTDLAGTGDSLKTRARHDPWLDAASVVPAGKLYYGDAYPATHPLISPLYGDVQGLPPILIQVGDWEILRDDSTRMADKIRAAGGQVELEVWPGMWHVFQGFAQMLPESRSAVQKIATFIQAQIAVPHAHA